MMPANFKLISAVFIFLILTGCSAIQIPYEPSTSAGDKEAAALLVDLSLSQEPSRGKPSQVEIQESSILWGKDKIFFATIKSVELLNKADKYLVQINFDGNVFRKNDWFIVYKSGNIDEAKRYIDVLVSLIKSRNSQFKNVVDGDTSKAPAPATTN